MTALTDLSTEDQITLMRTPNVLVMAASYAEQDGVFSIHREVKAGMQAGIDAASAFPDNQIIQRLALEMNSGDGAEMDALKEKAATSGDSDDVVEELNSGTVRPEAFRLARESLAIMEANATLEEAVEFKYWLYALADQVTRASKAGGFLGIGGVRVSPQEKAFLAELRTTLDIADDNVESSDLPDASDAAAAERLGEEDVEAGEELSIAELDAATINEVPADRPDEV